MDNIIEISDENRPLFLALAQELMEATVWDEAQGCWVRPEEAQ